MKCPVDGELSSERKKALTFCDAGPASRCFHNEDELYSLFVIHTARPVFETGCICVVIIEGFLFCPNKKALLFCIEKRRFFHA